MHKLVHTGSCLSFLLYGRAKNERKNFFYRGGAGGRGLVCRNGQKVKGKLVIEYRPTDFELEKNMSDGTFQILRLQANRFPPTLRLTRLTGL